MNVKKCYIAIIVTATLLLLFLPVGEASATLYCNRSYKELKRNPGRPYNAVGLLNNGCTAFLIDANHIVAAAHCFLDTATGDWQTGLRFYPNFHPSRVSRDEMHVPRGDVIRVVVGSRAGESVLGPGMDWAIAYVDHWQDTDEINMKPLALADSIPSTGTALVNPSYTRHHFPYNDSDRKTWDNMEWDSTHCGWVGPNGGMWAIQMRTAPIYDGVNRDTVGCNSRWGAGMIHADCSLTRVEGGKIIHNCDTVGGSSGSPVIYKDDGGKWSVIGVGHGGGNSSDFSQLVPVCSPDNPATSDNIAVSVDRFRDAPRFASNVAVHRSPNNASATAVFAVDSDLNRVVYRTRDSVQPTYTSPFNYWQSLGTPLPEGRLSRIAACSADADGQPQVFVVAENQMIYTRWASSGQWGEWSSFGIPDFVSQVADIDAATDANGRCLLFMASDTHGAFVRAKTSDTDWGDWFTVAGGSYKSVTALNYSDTVWAALLDLSGDIWRTSLGAAGWTSPNKLNPFEGIGAWRDIDLTWDEAGRGFMLAIPENGTDPTNNLWFTPLYGDQPWSEWRRFETHLWAPAAATVKDSPNLQSITASRWAEDLPGTTSPVVFATDESGNIYFVEYAHHSGLGWILDWKSFYHERIPYPPY